MEKKLNVKYQNSGNCFGKAYNAFDIVAAEKDSSKILAWYIGYYSSTKSIYKLYPQELTKYGKEAGYKMAKLTVNSNQVTKREEKIQ